MSEGDDKKLPMATLQTVHRLMEASQTELSTLYSHYPSLSGFPSLHQFETLLPIIGEDHPYLAVYEQKLDGIKARFPGSRPEIMYVSYQEAFERFREAIRFGKKMGIVDVESRGSRNGKGSGTILIERASAEMYLLPWIEHRIWDEQQNAMIAVIGMTGSGKSYAAIEIARLLVERSAGSKDRKFIFDIQVHVIFDIQTLIRIAYGEVALPRGTIIIFDDAGVGAGNRDWQDAYNVIMGKIAQSFRFMGFVFILTVPKTQFVDKQVREVLHAKLISVTNERGESDIGTFDFQVAHQDGEDILFYAPEINYTDFPSQKYEIHADEMLLSSFHFNKPPESLTAPYEEKKQRELKGQVLELKEAIDEAEAMNRARLDAMTEKYNKMIDEGARMLAEKERSVKMQALEAKEMEADARKAEAAQRKDKALRKMGKQTRVDPKDIVIIEGIKNGKTQESIAAELGISGPAVNQRKRRLEDEGKLIAQ